MTAKLSSSGFTLIEVIIALLILSFLSLFTVESIQRALKAKVKIQGQIDKTSSLRDALRIIERDINMAYNYRDSYVELYNQTQQYRQKAAESKGTKTGDQGTQTDQDAQRKAQEAADQAAAAAASSGAANTDRYKLKPVKVTSQFLGDSESLDFTSVSNIRMMEDSAISSQAEIGYKLKPCRKRSNQEASSNCLWRRVANYIHDDITKDGQETVLLENVTEFKLRYLGPGKEEEWATQWLTNERGDDITKNKFPYAVEVTITVRDDSKKEKDKDLRMTIVAAIRNPNNPPEADKGAAATVGGGAAK